MSERSNHEKAKLDYARRQACWQMATLEVANMTEHDRMMELIQVRADAYHEMCLPDSMLLMEVYPMPAKQEKKK